MMVAMVVALKSVLDYESTVRAIGVCMVGWIVYWLVIIGLGILVAGMFI